MSLINLSLAPIEKSLKFMERYFPTDRRTSGININWIEEMIVLRQKAFNRAEKEALKQIYRKTGGLRNLPNGVTNLEDAKALKDLAIQLNSGKTVNLTPDAQKALNNMGLTKVTPELLNRVVQKYNNPELNNRFDSIRKIRIRNHIKDTGEMPELQKSAVRVMENMKKDPRVSEEYITPTSPDSKNIIRFLRKKTGTVVVPSNNGSYSRLIVNPNNIPEGLTQRQIKGIKSGKITRLIGLKENAPEEVILHEAGHNISRSTIPGSSDYGLNNSLKYYNPNTGNFLTDTAEKLVADESASLIKGNGNYKRLVADIGNVAEENLASAYSLDKLKNSPNFALRKKNLDNALGTYVRDLKSGEMERISFRPLT
jgi:hypothetical protein